MTFVFIIAFLSLATSSVCAHIYKHVLHVCGNYNFVCLVSVKLDVGEITRYVTEEGANIKRYIFLRFREGSKITKNNLLQF